MSRRLVVVVTAVLLLAAPMGAAANTFGGISGFVVDGATARPVPGVAIIIARLPENVETRHSLLANRKGFFVNLGLEPGRYAVTANVMGRSATCVIDDVYADQVRSVRIVLGAANGEPRCFRAQFHRSVVNPDETADVYRI
jgi:carboxypeptidase family protein